MLNKVEFIGRNILECNKGEKNVSYGSCWTLVSFFRDNSISFILSLVANLLIFGISNKYLIKSNTQ